MSDKKRNWLHKLFGHEEPQGGASTPEDPGSGEPLDGILDELERPHPVFDKLKMNQGLMLEETLVKAFNERGYHAEVNGKDVRITPPSGRPSTVHLDNLYLQVSNLRNIDADMPQVVHAFVSSLLSVRPATSYRDADFFRGMRVRLQPIDSLEWEEWAMDALGLPVTLRTESDQNGPQPLFRTKSGGIGTAAQGDTQGAGGAGNSGGSSGSGDDVQLDSEVVQPLFTKDSPVQPWSEDTIVRLCFDSEESVENLNPSSLEDRGPVEDLYRMGYRNLWQELIDSDLSAVRFTPSEEQRFGASQASTLPPSMQDANAEESCWLLETSSFFGGSIPLFLDEIMERYAPEVDRSKGLIFAMPHRHLTLVREVTNGASLMNSIGLMVSITAEQYTSQPGSISPRLHLWHEGQVETFTDIIWGDDERQAEIQVKPSPYLMAKINEGLDGPEGPEGLEGSGGGPEPF